jgi:hypothetical protein
MIYIDTNQTPQLLGNWAGEDQMRCSFGAGITYGACVILEYGFLLQIGPALDAVLHQQTAEVLHFWRCVIAPDECRKGSIVAIVLDCANTSLTSTLVCSFCDE